MPNFPESGVKLVIEGLAIAQQGVDDLTSSLDDLQGQSYEVEVTTTVDNSAIDDLPLDGDNVDFTVNETVDVETADETSKGILDAVQSLNAKETFKMVVDIAGTALDFLKAFEKFSVEPMLDLEDAVARVNAQTGGAIPNAKELISGIFYDDLGDSIDQVGKLVIKAAQIKAPIDEAVRASLAFTHTFTDQNPEEVLNALNQIVIGKLAPNFTEAGNLLVRAFQTSANRGGDLLSTLSNNAIAIHDLGLNGPEALSFIDTGMKAGFKSAQNVLDVLLKIKQNVTNAAGNQTSDVTKTLKKLGIANPAETGEAWSAEFFTAVIDKIKNAPGLSDTDKEALFTNLVGGKQGAKTFSSFLEISPDEAKTIFANLSGAAADAAKEADNSLRGAIDDFTLAAQKAVEDWLSSSAIDLPGKIAALKTGLQNALDTLAQGGSLSDALTIALKPIGFDDEFRGLESVLGNFVIAILQAVSFLQSLDPANWSAKAGTDAIIQQQGAKQLSFDLKIANPDEVATDIATATSRGLSDKKIADIVSGTINQLINDGTKDSLAKAQVLVDTLKAPIDMNKVPLLANGTPMNVEPVVSDDAIATMQGKIDTAMKSAPPPDAIKQLSDTWGLVDNSITGVHDKAMASINPLDKVTDSTRKLGNEASDAAPYTVDLSSGINDVATSAELATISLDSVKTKLDLITASATSVGNAADVLATKQGTGGGAAPTSVAVGGGAGNGPSLGGMSVNAILSAIQGFMPGASFSGKSGGNVNTIVNNNNLPNIATADALGYRQAATLRGMQGG